MPASAVGTVFPSGSCAGIACTGRTWVWRCVVPMFRWPHDLHANRLRLPDFREQGGGRVPKCMEGGTINGAAERQSGPSTRRSQTPRIVLTGRY